MKEFIEFLVTQIVKNPDDVVIEEEINGTVTNIKVCANQDDMGTIIGKNGKTIRSIRALAKAKAIRENVKVYIEVC